MRTITAAALTDTVARLCIQANTKLPKDIVAALDREPEGYPCSLLHPPAGLEEARHSLDLGGGLSPEGQPRLTRAVYTVELKNSAGEPYAIRLDVESTVNVMSLALRVLLV